MKHAFRGMKCTMGRKSIAVCGQNLHILPIFNMKCSFRLMFCVEFAITGAWLSILPGSLTVKQYLELPQDVITHFVETCCYFIYGMYSFNTMACLRKRQQQKNRTWSKYSGYKYLDWFRRLASKPTWLESNGLFCGDTGNNRCIQSFHQHCRKYNDILRIPAYYPLYYNMFNVKFIHGSRCERELMERSLNIENTGMIRSSKKKRNVHGVNMMWLAIVAH